MIEPTSQAVGKQENGSKSKHDVDEPRHSCPASQRDEVKISPDTDFDEDYGEPPAERCLAKSLKARSTPSLTRQAGNIHMLHRVYIYSQYKPSSLSRT